MTSLNHASPRAAGLLEIDALIVPLQEEPPAELEALGTWLQALVDRGGVQVQRGAAGHEAPSGALQNGQGAAVPEWILSRDGHSFSLLVCRGAPEHTPPAPAPAAPPTPAMDGGAAALLAGPHLLLRCPAPRGGLGLAAWGEEGLLRALSRVSAVLCRLGAAVVLPQAQRAVRESAAFLRLLGDLTDPTCVPFAAWIDWRLTPDKSALRSAGMELLGLPDIQVRLGGGPGTWAWERGQEALLYLCHRMARTGQLPAPGTALEVPIGAQIGAYPLPPQAPGLDGERYRLGEREGVPELQREEEAKDATERWDAACQGGAPVGLNTYQALFRHSLPVSLPGELVAVFSPPDLPAEAPGHAVDVRRDRKQGFWLVSNGLGRLQQPGGSAEEGSSRVELLAHVEQHSPALASLLSSLAEAVHGHGGGAETWRPGDTLTLPDEVAAEVGVQHLLLAQGGEVSFTRGAPVSLILVVPLYQHEMERVQEERSAKWFGEPLSEPARTEELRRRWKGVGT